MKEKRYTSNELIHKMKTEQGITFHYTSMQEATFYLDHVNNYYRVASYRQNYQKQNKSQGDPNRYILLDFAYLQELSIIDMHLRYILTKMCIDLEHAMKVQLSNLISRMECEDGYEIVNEFLKNDVQLLEKIEKRNSFLVEELNVSNCPIWVLNELLTFGEFIRFYSFCCQKLQLQIFPQNILNLIRELRNACAHNNCIIANLNIGQVYAPNMIKQQVAKIRNISKDQRRKKLTNRTLLCFSCLAYAYGQIVSPKVKQHRVAELKELFYKRMTQKKGFFTKNELILSSYNFALKIIKNFL